MQVASIALLFLSVKFAAASLVEPAPLATAKEDVPLVQAVSVGALLRPSSAPWPVVYAEPERALKMAAPKLKTRPRTSNGAGKAGRIGARPGRKGPRGKALRSASRKSGKGPRGKSGFGGKALRSRKSGIRRPKGLSAGKSLNRIKSRGLGKRPKRAAAF
ncbi:unnamed protein product [Aphanomyces euteiches]|uniref:Uncharacterized protein n=1 Tax=Aphanomyces euteiches TaxID=100861 RepID=A0A6G0XAI9_9STRA|nr:hypothetical protein Ae201684_006901 [Aphanomyces euteiches]KAH9086835.1 hypothetical protein Ae201684P_000253 [Aphanomyces euteiches]KAH9158082.1 hypothetical protein AeRB84_000118 [Aphanomyces euteiches]